MISMSILKDGNVAVYNLERRGREPVFLSGPRVGKHRETVWQVNTDCRDHRSELDNRTIIRCRIRQVWKRLKPD